MAVVTPPPPDQPEDMTRFAPPAGSIVVGVDGSEGSDRAVARAAELAELDGRSLVVVHSTEQVGLRDTAWLDVQGIDHRELRLALDEAAKAIVSRAEQQALALVPTLTVHGALTRDDPRIALLDASRSAACVVVGSRGRGPVLSNLLGSVSAYVARYSECPVLVDRTDDRAQPLDRVVVGVDDSPGSVAVLENAFEQAALRGLPLTVMPCFDLLVTEGHELTASVTELRAKHPDLDVDLDTTRGLVQDCLDGLGPRTALLVIGQPPMSGWERLVHFSSALAVLERSHTPVLVVPETACRKGTHP